MAQQQWEVEPATGTCAATGRKFEEGEEFYTVLFEDGDSFRRADYCLDAWTEPPERSFCHFKTRVPVKEKRKRLLVDDELLVNFFQRLEDELEPIRVQFRFVIALILMRKRLLRYENSTTEDGEEVWRMTLIRDKTPHRIVNPRLTDDQIEGVSQQLSAILHGDMGEWASGPAEGEAAPPDPDEVADDGA